ncbi:LuxR C-terminal-related transcriptional regulator [Rhizobium sp. CNPSo 4062]|uniref:LuxR C-terminal-related transcriptional regulator n=1 Tax=Rhizobium sp. CNPSo 4062 TaxID=3021410 RepID=UPI000DDD3636
MCLSAKCRESTAWCRALAAWLSPVRARFRTVKFHLGNLFRKLGCHRRAEATRAATALGWL